MAHTSVMRQTRLCLELFVTRGTRVVPDCSVCKLMFPHVLWIHEPRVALTARIRPLVFVLRVCVAVQKSLASELHATLSALVPPLPQVNVADMGVEVLLLVEPHPTHLALEWLVPRVNPPVIDKLEMSGKLLSALSASPGSVTSVHRSLVYGESVLIVDSDAAQRTDNWGLNFCLIREIILLKVLGRFTLVNSS